MKFSSLVSLTIFTVSTVSQNVPNILIYGSAGSQEDQAAIKLGYNTTIVTDSEWANMSTVNFTRFDAVVVPDLSADSISSLDFLEKSKDIWSPAITGNIIVIGETTFSNSSYESLQAQVATQGIMPVTLARAYSLKIPFALLLPVVNYKGRLASIWLSHACMTA